MTETPTSNVDEVESQATAPSETSATKTQPDEEQTPLDLGAIMADMSDYELVQVGLVALAILHKRADPNVDGSGK